MVGGGAQSGCYLEFRPLSAKDMGTLTSVRVSGVHKYLTQGN